MLLCSVSLSHSWSNPIWCIQVPAFDLYLFGISNLHIKMPVSLNRITSPLHTQTNICVYERQVYTSKCSLDVHEMKMNLSRSDSVRPRDVAGCQSEHPVSPVKVQVPCKWRPGDSFHYYVFTIHCCWHIRLMSGWLLHSLFICGKWRCCHDVL